ncbi:unnamed protein product [Ilex paraguariensis]|uniref:J domain-containing protein n=1 Tax=Ilex paraguariensis TaxID=185542 RepID=A0ABC8TC40_9AQUA
MEISLQINAKIDKMVTLCYKPKYSQKHSNLKSFSCQAKRLAMQSGEIKTNFYEVLSLVGSENVGFDEINKAYRSMALQYHPDVCPLATKEESTNRFVELRKAYETLSDPISRKRYDYELGLVDSFACGFGSLCVEERRANFPKEVWERQLSGLEKRSRDRVEKKKNGCMKKES